MINVIVIFVIILTTTNHTKASVSSRVMAGPSTDGGEPTEKTRLIHKDRHVKCRLRCCSGTCTVGKTRVVDDIIPSACACLQCSLESYLLCHVCMTFDV